MIKNHLLRVLLVSQTIDAPTFTGMVCHAAARPRVLAVSTIPDAVERLSTDTYDAVVLDVDACDGSVTGAMGMIQTADPALAIVVLSGEHDDDETIAGIELGAEGHLLRDHLDTASVSRSVKFAVARKRAETERIRVALHDPLTGLQNRLAVEGFLPVALQRAERRGTRVGIVFADIAVSPTTPLEGAPEVWNQLVLQAASRLRLVARESDTVARIARNTFVIVCEDLALEHSVRGIADRLTEEFQQPVMLADDRSVMLDVTLAFTGGDGTTDAAVLLRRLGQSAVRTAEEDDQRQIVLPGGMHIDVDAVAPQPVASARANR